MSHTVMLTVARLFFGSVAVAVKAAFYDVRAPPIICTVTAVQALHFTSRLSANANITIAELSF